MQSLWIDLPGVEVNTGYRRVAEVWRLQFGEDVGDNLKPTTSGQQAPFVLSHLLTLTFAAPAQAARPWVISISHLGTEREPSLATTFLWFGLSHYSTGR